MTFALLCVSAVPVPTLAQDKPVHLDTVLVAGQRVPLSSFPGAVTVVDMDAARETQRQVSLTEVLSDVPGLLALDRGNYAQDVQLQSRGLGSRSTFGIRGLTLISEGIPATALDGQSHAATFALGSLDHIAVIRGPLALQYGAGAGGAIIGESVLDDKPLQRVNAWVGSENSSRIGARTDGAAQSWRWRVTGDNFRTDGARRHSAAVRNQLNAVMQWRPTDKQQLLMSMQVLGQPSTEDPLGITREQWQTDPRGTDMVATAFNTRKSIGNRQLGMKWSDDYRNNRRWWLSGWVTQRAIEQYLAIPASAQTPASHAGGVIDFTRDAVGMSFGHRWSSHRGALAVGADIGRMQEDRQGYENFIGSTLGVKGRLRRDEINTLSSRELWAVWEHRWHQRWSVLAGARQSSMTFVNHDQFLSNGDDSGRVRFDNSAFSAGLARSFERGEIFGSLGRGFDSPTASELAYRSDGLGGLNMSLRPAAFISAEMGIRMRGPSGSLQTFTAYRIGTRDEIVPVLSSGGRSSFANASRTRRVGAEFSASGAVNSRLDYRVALNAIDAKFSRGYTGTVIRNGVPVVHSVRSGNSIPGVPSVHGFAELSWGLARVPLTATLDVAGNSRITVDDANSDYAPGNVLVGTSLRWRSNTTPGLSGFLRISNVLDSRAVGSVIVNESNGRSFEPAAGRTLTLGLSWSRL